MTARALLERFTSAADDNFINYQNTDYDALFQQAQATADDAEQTELYKQMERNLTEHAANVYIQDLADLVVLRNGLEGYQFYPIYVMDQIGSGVTDHDWIDEMAIKESIGLLSDREKKILSLRFLAGRTQTEVAEEIGISQAQISRLEKNAIRKIKESL